MQVTEVWHRVNALLREMADEDLTDESLIVIRSFLPVFQAWTRQACKEQLARKKAARCDPGGKVAPGDGAGSNQ